MAKRQGSKSQRSREEDIRDGVLWRVVFETFRPIESYPRPIVIARECVSSIDYRHEGRFRQAEPWYLFKYSLRGEGVFCDGDGEHRIAAGSAFVRHIPDQQTSYYYPADGTDTWDFLYFNMTGGALGEMIDGLLDRYGPVYQLSRDEAIIQRLLEYSSYGDTEIHINPSAGSQLVSSLLESLLSSAEKLQPEQPSASLSAMAIRIIRENLHRNLNVTELAELLGVSREHFSRVFNEQTSMTPLKYITQQKMLLAGHMLKETALTNQQIAARLGYPDPAHFARIFRRHYQMTPGRFRKVGSVPLR